MTALRPEELNRNFAVGELQAMHLAGELTRHGIPGFEFYLPVGEFPSLETRAASLETLMRPGRTITGRSARWVHVGGPVPPHVELSRRSGTPLRVDEAVRCRFRRLKASDVMRLGGLVLTTPRRTALDLRREGFETEARMLDPLVDAVRPGSAAS
ncbi:hypothetical protein C7K25_06665 [Gulosibacter molinativorax]|uniref:AbiEi antitoxin C-terminal domain-containing protein n=1 Tax=Gulosibacter molinativorax TaxID=256821 RepID=A0ABT7C7A4_9MICO|nr:hypothetical protein [Gulosibacter molinativorax]